MARGRDGRPGVRRLRGRKRRRFRDRLPDGEREMKVQIYFTNKKQIILKEKVISHLAFSAPIFKCSPNGMANTGEI